MDHDSSYNKIFQQFPFWFAQVISRVKVELVHTEHNVITKKENKKNKDMREEKNQTNKAKSKTPPQIIKYLKKKSSNRQTSKMEQDIVWSDW